MGFGVARGGVAALSCPPSQLCVGSASILDLFLPVRKVALGSRPGPGFVLRSPLRVSFHVSLAQLGLGRPTPRTSHRPGEYDGLD